MPFPPEFSNDTVIEQLQNLIGQLERREAIADRLKIIPERPDN